MNAEKAGSRDINALTELRLSYLLEDNGSLENSQKETVKRLLPDYFHEHLNKDLFAYVIRRDGIIVSCAFLLMIMKPMSPAFINGKTATVLNVYTRPLYRHMGYARRIMETMLADAREQDLSVIDLKATEDGYALYQSVGFEDDHSKYHLMKWKNS
jgi:ribosomal protein S18 acetylase RimI-like enzyme